MCLVGWKSTENIPDANGEELSALIPAIHLMFAFRLGVGRLPISLYGLYLTEQELFQVISGQFHG